MRLGFREDTRGVSALVGAVLLLGILVIALASYQAIIVPQQNAQTEFDHNQQVEDEMVDFRNALLEARLDERERAPSVKLGTRYQSRTLAVNPPPATGTLQNISQDNMRVNESGTGDEILNLTGNQFFEYTPSYSEYRDAGTIRYENTLVYHDFGSDNITLSNQRLLTDESPSGFDVDGTIRLVPSEPSIDEQGTDRVSYEPTPERARFVTVTDPEITLPTELPVDDSDRTSWTELLDGQIDEDDEISEGPNGELVLELDGTYLIKYSFVANQDNLPDDEREEDDGDTGEVSPPPSVIDDERLRFDGLPFAEASISGNTIRSVTYTFSVFNPNDVDYQVRFLLKNSAQQTTSVGPDVRPSSPKTVESGDGDALPQGDVNQDGFVDVEIMLLNENNNIIDIRTGRLDGKGGGEDETVLT